MVESQPTRDIGHVFVGRQQEMAELIVMIDGEPGSGKTRIAQELASYAEQGGTKVL